MQCAEHPKTETNLRCGKCDKPICPKCMVHTPVGARCKTCAQLKRLPIFEVTSSQYVIAVGVGAALAVVVGTAWAFLSIPFISFWIPLGVGYLIGEVISQAANRKRSPGLQFIVGLSVVAAYLISRMVPIMARLLSSEVPLSAKVLGQVSFAIIAGTFTQPLLLLVLALGIYLGVTRVR